jgi:hypothetical protein
MQSRSLARSFQITLAAAPAMSPPELHFDFPHAWTARLLAVPPLIAPVRSFVYPRQIAGEEDALARGALLVDVQPEGAGNFLATCALGFAEIGALRGVWSCPEPREMCAIAGGYAYIIDTQAPEMSTHVNLRPVVEVHASVSHRLLLFVGFHAVVAWGEKGLAWQTPRITWEGLTITGLSEDKLHGTAWDMPRDREVPFEVDLRSGQHTGGSAPRI